MVFTEAELEYLHTARLGRLATLSQNGILQNSPVGFEVRGVAEALTGQTPPNPYLSGEVIRIHPRRIISWGMGPNGDQGSKRNVDPPVTSGNQ